MNFSPGWGIHGYVYNLTEEKKVSGIVTTNITKTRQQVALYNGSGHSHTTLPIIVTTEG